jgi:hypothetical protein
MHIETCVTSASPSFAGQIVEHRARTPQPYVFLHRCQTSERASHAPLLEFAGFELWCASSGMRRLRGDALRHRMYASRGYKQSCGCTDAADALTLTLQACRGDDVFGTITVRFDSTEGLAADALYRREIDVYRSAGASVCELTRLAVSNEHDSKQLLGSLFHVAYLVFGLLAGATDLFIEVNPRHAKFYERMLGFEPKGECRTCARVQAPAVLMHVETSYIAARISAAQGQQRSRERSLYAYSLSREQEEKALSQILAAHAAAAWLAPATEMHGVPSPRSHSGESLIHSIC